MADCDCEYCSVEGSCRYAYNETICRVSEINECKIIADDKFIEFHNHLKEVNKDICNDEVESIISHMSDIIHNSQQVV
jgi:hypothetical protein